MSRFRFYILPRICLGLSTLLLLFGLWTLWLSLGRPLPTMALACRQAASTGFLEDSRLLASGPVKLEGYHQEDAWALFQSGTWYGLTSLERRAGLLWSASDLRLISPDALRGTGLYAFPAALATVWSPGEIWRDNYDIRNTDLYSEVVPLAICTDPSVVRLEGEFLVLGSWENPEAAWAERAVSISWTAAGNGVWVGEAVTSLIPRSSDDSSGGATAVRCRGYDADGSLVCSYTPTAD